MEYSSQPQDPINSRDFNQEAAAQYLRTLGREDLEALALRGLKLALATEERITELGKEKDETAAEALRYQEMALIDDLTGALNRRGTVAKIQEHLIELRHGGRSGDAQAVILLYGDVWRFKDINELEGLPGGDEALWQIAGNLMLSVSDRDSVGRVGGDEFVMVVPLSDASAAETVTRRIIERVDYHLESQDHKNHEDGLGYTLGVNFGAITITPDMSQMDPEELLDKASHAMQDEKRLQRENAARAEVAEILETPPEAQA